MEEDGFVIVSKDSAAKEDDAVSVASDRSSILLVEDPAADPLLVQSDDSEEEDLPQEHVEREREVTVTDDLSAAQDERKSAPAAEDSTVKAIPSEQPKYVCSTCSVDIAGKSDVVWEGYMGANVPAFLFHKTRNLEPAAEPRQQQLSTGMFLVQDMKCKSCSAAFGWNYIKAWNQDQKYKEGTTIIQRSLVQKMP